MSGERRYADDRGNNNIYFFIGINSTKRNSILFYGAERVNAISKFFFYVYVVLFLHITRQRAMNSIGKCKLLLCRVRERCCDDDVRPDSPIFSSPVSPTISHIHMSHRIESIRFISFHSRSGQFVWIALNLTIWVLSARSRRARESNKREIVNDDGFLRLSGRIRQQVQTAQVRHFNRPKKNSLISWINLDLAPTRDTYRKKLRESDHVGPCRWRLESKELFQFHTNIIIYPSSTHTRPSLLAQLLLQTAKREREGGCSTFNFHAQNKHSRRAIVRFHLDEQKAAE